MTQSYEDYEKEYEDHLSKVRSFLAGTRNQSTLQECQRLLSSAKSSATAMQGLAEVEGNTLRQQEAQQKLQRDLAPLSREVDRQLAEFNNRQDLFYQAPGTSGAGSQQMNGDFESLLQSSDDLLQDTRVVLAETEQIGTSTLMQMGRQREQLQNTNSNLEHLQVATGEARRILVSMGRRALKTKIGLYCTISFLVMANLYVIVKIWHKHHPAADDSETPDNP